MPSKPDLAATLVWGGTALLGAASLSIVALDRGEHVNALWLVTAALCTYALAYRFYSLFIARSVVGLDATRITPAHRRNDGLDYVPTNKVVLFGHHFAAIAGAGPLVGPVLAAQMGYLPGTLWILAGVVFAGAVQDFLVLTFSVRRDGRSLGEMIRGEMGPFAGTVASIGVLLIMIILLAVLALIVVKALANSPWGLFTVAATIPIALAMGLYARFLRPHRILEMSAAGRAASARRHLARRPGRGDTRLGGGLHLLRHIAALMLMAYGFLASVLPVWLVLAPRDYLSTFLKIGTICGAGTRHRHHHAGIAHARPDALHRRHRPGLRRIAFPVPLHHHCLWLGQRISRLGLLGHHAENAGERNPGTPDRLRRDADRKPGRHHGADRRQRHRTRRLFRHERAARRHRQHGAIGRRHRLGLGFRHHAPTRSPPSPTRSARPRSWRAPAARRRWQSAWRASSRA